MNSATWSLILDITSNLTFNNQYLIKKVKIQQVFGFFLNAFSIILIYNPLVLSTFRPFPHSWLITGLVTRVTRRVPLMEQELLTIPEHLNSCLSFSLFLLTTVLSVLLLRILNTPIGFFKLILYMYIFRRVEIIGIFGTVTPRLVHCWRFGTIPSPLVHCGRFRTIIPKTFHFGRFGTITPSLLHWSV
jgi:hypothetical protein